MGLGFFLIPNLAYACSKKTPKIDKSIYLKIQVEKSEQKDCSKAKTCENNKNHQDCNGKCKHSSCECSISASPFSLSLPTEINTKDLFTALEKQKFTFKKAYYSSGYLSIWLPPKIS